MTRRRTKTRGRPRPLGAEGEGARLPGAIAVLDALPVAAIACLDPATGTCIANDRARELLGLSSAELPLHPAKGDTPFSFVKETRRLDPGEGPLERALEGRDVPPHPLRVVRDDGRAVPVVASASALPGGGAVLVLVELAEEERPQELLESHQATLAMLGVYALSEGDLARVLQKAAEAAARELGVELAGCLRLDAAAGDFLLVAGTGWDEGSIGRARVEGDESTLAGQAIRQQKPVAADGPVLESCKVAALHGARSGVAVVVQGPERLPWGALCVLSRRERRFRDEEVHFLQTVAILLSVALARARTEEKLIESERRLALAESEEQLARSEHLAALGTLAAGIAHEINNPIASILVNAEYGELRLAEGDSEGAREAFRTIAEQAKRCGGITRNVLRFAEPGGPPRVRGDLGTAVRRALALADSYLRLNETEVEVAIADDLPEVELDPASVQHALVHLLRNSAESREGSVRVRVSAEPKGDEVVLRVTDDGPGIRPEDLHRVFDPFFTTRREMGGVGLGLNLVYRAVADHGGRVEARSRPGEGAEILIRLPRARETS